MPYRVWDPEWAGGCSQVLPWTQGGKMGRPGRSKAGQTPLLLVSKLDILILEAPCSSSPSTYCLRSDFLPVSPAWPPPHPACCGQAAQRALTSPKVWILVWIEATWGTGPGWRTGLEGPGSQSSLGSTPHSTHTLCRDSLACSDHPLSAFSEPTLPWGSGLSQSAPGPGACICLINNLTLLLPLPHSL